MILMSSISYYPSTSMSNVCRCLLLGILLILSGCAITPDSIVKQPTTAKAAPTSEVAANSGAIYNAKAYHPLFEDRRPRYVGDIVTINIAENTSATKAGGSSNSANGSASASFQPFRKVTPAISTLEVSGSNSYADKAAANASNVFTGSITATVVEVLPNGFLMVSGDKQIAFDKGTEFVRFSGVVNPDTITQGNVVTSTKVADARIEYRTNSKIDAAEVTNMFARFFLSIIAF
jgi:flagellar L-ring protein precursor FlgH